MKKKRATTSASNISRRHDCPGSAAIEDGIPEVDSEFSAEGTMLHALYMTGKRPPTLTEDQAVALNLADFYTAEFFANVRARFEIDPLAAYIDEREVALVIQDAKGNDLFPGHADLIRTWPAYNVRAIADAKFGVMEVEHAADNFQLVSYAVGRQQISPAKALGVAIAQPRNFGPRLSQAIYTRESIPAAAAELERIVRETEKPNAPRIPGAKQCHFCKAKAICPEYKAEFMEIQTVGAFPITEMPSGDLEKMHVAIAFANKIKDEVSGEMRRRIGEGTMPGWKLQNSGDTVKLDDALSFFNVLKARFHDEPLFTARSFDNCRAMEWGKLVDLIQALTGQSEKKTKELIVTLSEGMVTRTKKAEKIVRDKGPKALE